MNPLHYTRRRLGGSASVTGAAGTAAQISLYNDSTIGHLLLVYYWATWCNSGNNNFTAFFRQGSVGSLVTRGINVVSGEQAMAGSIYSQAIAVPPDIGISMSQGTANNSANAELVWFIVRPNWSLVFQEQTVNITAAATFWWQDMEPSLLWPDDVK